ncbi:vacuolar iron transporter homolog 4-like [Prosopis cineraria]|uniref:vacuolar iron transporter homolog 4-like n=1 Tax=Prosopis cineraria TaxID=364024 RepID=UPI00240E9FEB|nr:vacuolar iron transporter homolog 4-like [Prosopis cineraria]
MASTTAHNIGTSQNEMVVEIPNHTNGTTLPNPKPSLPTIGENPNKDDDTDYSQRGQWLRAAVLGANDGLVSVASIMMGVGAVKEDIAAMLLSGFAGLVAGACSMAIGEFVSVYTQYDIEKEQLKRESKNEEEEDEEKKELEKLPSPYQAALASALAFSVGAVVPLLGAVFIRNYRVRLGVVAAVVSLALLVFGGVGAVLGNTSVKKSCIRVLIGGWTAMAITFGLTKLIGATGL